jgi:uncharacterized protein YqgC (DUF456 family)
MLSALGTAVFFLFLLVSLFSLLLGIPGNWMILGASCLYGYLTGFQELTGRMLWVLALMTVAGEGVEYLMGIVGAKRFGSSNRGIVFSMVGGVVGAMVCAPLFFGFGAILGALGGAFLGAVLVEIATDGSDQWRKALRSGFGNFLGRIGGMITKLALGTGMIVWIAYSILT